MARPVPCPIPFKLTLPQATVLSYFTGLGPVGTPVEVSIRDLSDDLGFRNPRSFYDHLATLMAGGFVRRLYRGSGGSTGALVVLKRLEDDPPPPPVVEAPMPRRAAEERSDSMAKIDAYARLAEIPRDTRTPAQRLMGEPVFERSALFAKRVDG
jgi:hypothetical protein